MVHEFKVHATWLFHWHNQSYWEKIISNKMQLIKYFYRLYNNFFLWVHTLTEFVKNGMRTKSSKIARTPAMAEINAKLKTLIAKKYAKSL